MWRRLIYLFIIPAFFVLLAGSVSAQESGAGVSVAGTRGWAILADGRAKPLETFARSTLETLSGKTKLDGMSALTILWGFHLAEKDFKARPVIRIYNNDLKRRIGLDPNQRRFSFAAIMNNKEYRSLVDRALVRQDKEMGLIAVEKEALDIYGKLQIVGGLAGPGRLLKLVPLVTKDGSWSTLAELKGERAPDKKALYADYLALSQAYRKGDGAGFNQIIGRLTSALRESKPGVYPSTANLAWELHYNDLDPFRVSWILYLLSFLSLVLASLIWPRVGFGAGVILLALGLGFHSYGVGIRWIISGRAPLSNMFESLVFMSWGITALGLGMEFFNRKGYFAIVAAVMGFVSLIIAWLMPPHMSGITPLVPVLANTSWLSIHVMTIMMAYSAFALTMALAHIILGIMLFRPAKRDLTQALSKLLYKATQVGLFFLTAGIIFGAIWANESWGRYWGWDPKETWSLVTFFVYLGVVHGRFAGWFRDFGLAVGSIIGFLAVLMTYYGVNYILNSGLHSYGTSSGGLWVVGLFVAFEAAVILLALFRRIDSVKQPAP